MFLCLGCFAFSYVNITTNLHSWKFCGELVDRASGKCCGPKYTQCTKRFKVYPLITLIPAENLHGISLASNELLLNLEVFFTIAGSKCTQMIWKEISSTLSEVTSFSVAVYCIARNFGEVFNLANWRFCGQSPNLKPANIISYTIALCRGARDYQIKNSPMHFYD